MGRSSRVASSFGDGGVVGERVHPVRRVGPTRDVPGRDDVQVDAVVRVVHRRRVHRGEHGEDGEVLRRQRQGIWREAGH